MHSHSLETWTHEHVFLGERHAANERRVWLIVGLSLAMMVGEVVGGTLYGSLALVADGWHMSTHAAALAIAALAYRYARRHARDARFAFGTGKLGDLAAFASAIVLAMIALLIGYESVLRLIAPVAIATGEAMAIAALGLAVNLASARLLGDEHHHDRADGNQHGHELGHNHGHDHDLAHHGHDHPARDNNLRAAYVHVLADAATSVLAILGLAAAGWLGWTFMDPLVGLVSTAVILSWAYGLVRQSGAVLIDAVPDAGLPAAIRQAVEVEGDRVSDLHVWQLGPGHAAAIVAVVSDDPQSPGAYKRRLAQVRGLSHVTVEVERCREHGAPGRRAA